MNSKDKISNMFEHVEGPVPWLEIAVDETIVLRGLDKPVAPTLLESTIPVDVSWYDRTTFARKLGLDALGLYHWETFGSTKDDTRPVLHITPHILTRDDLPRLQIPTPHYEELYPEVLAAQGAIGDSGVALFVEFAACLEFAMADMGFLNFCTNLHHDPMFVEEVLDRYASYSAQLVDIYNRMPEIDFIWIGDDLAYKSGPFCSPEMMRRHVFPHIERVVRKINKPWIFHSDGMMDMLMEDILAWGPQAIHPIEGDTERLIEFKRKYGQSIALVGNLSVDLLARGSPQEIEEIAESMLVACSPGGGYGFSSGNALARYIRIENLYSAAETLRRFNQKPAPIASSQAEVCGNERPGL